MTENDDNIWEYDNIRINDEGKVVGSAYTFSFRGGFDIQIVVSSYTYERNGEFKMNHVPNVVLTDPLGSIVSEPYTHDSHSAKKAIESARETARDVYEHPERYID
jgi:hypothetical protein